MSGTGDWSVRAVHRHEQHHQKGRLRQLVPQHLILHHTRLQPSRFAACNMTHSQLMVRCRTSTINVDPNSNNMSHECNQLNYWTVSYPEVHRSYFLGPGTYVFAYYYTLLFAIFEYCRCCHHLSLSLSRSLACSLSLSLSLALSLSLCIASALFSNPFASQLGLVGRPRKPRKA